MFQGTDKPCGLCKKPVIGDCMISGGKYYHKNCMKVFMIRLLYFENY